MKRIAIFLIVASLIVSSAFAKKVGIYKGTRDLITDSLLKTLEEEGWEHVFISPKEMADLEKLSETDVLLFTGGWNDYFFPSYEARRALHKYIAGGKGILSSGFRSGYSRTASRPLFPQIGGTHNRGNGTFIVAEGDSVLAKALTEPYSPGGWDHVVLFVGPEGKVFATCAGDPVGAYGEVYGGRYIAYGAFVAYNESAEAVTGVERSFLMAALDWLASAPKRSEAEIAKASAQAELDFLRREKTLDWTFFGRGPDTGSGIIPAAFQQNAIPLESRIFRLDFINSLFDKPIDKVVPVARKLQSALDALTAQKSRMEAATLTRINKASVAELDEWKTDKNKQIEETREKLMPAGQLKELVEEADELIASLKPAIEKEKQSRLAKEQQKDALAISELAKQATSKDFETRLNAVTELARIGQKQCEAPLINALKDVNEEVRVNAILGLGWMQSKAAVPQLIDLAKGNDLRMKRRATQALGQIGDARAVPVLRSLIKCDDIDTADNAIFGLGWLKAKEAIPDLINILNTYSR
ncbi:MAG: hypothetical protein GX811_00185, partial [Lentisphaerae bacterium]|nr:hypothetical protein [Lentisphaerota bacterium]